MLKMTQLAKKTRFAIAYPLFALIVLFARTNERSMHLGFAIILVGEALRIWANGYIGTRKVNTRSGENRIGALVTAGPYGFVRHPLYLGTFLIAAGICVTAANPWIAVVLMGTLLTVYRKKMTQEDDLLAAECGDEHARYRRQVPLWFPNGRRFSDRSGKWSFDGIVASKEWTTLLWLAALYGGLYLREEWFEEGEFFAAGEPGEWTKHLLVIAAILLVITIDLALKDFRWRRQTRKILSEIVLLAVVFCARPAFAEGESDAMRDLRLKALVTAPAELGFKPSAAFPEVYGVVMDWPLGGGNVGTVASFADGKAGFYSTSMFGITGDPADADVRGAAITLVRAARDYAAQALPTTDFSYPTPERVRFYLLTFSGVKLVEADRETLESGRSPHWPLFSAAQGVLSRLRATDKR